MKQTTKAVSTTITRRRTIPDGKALWSGLFHFLIRPDCDLEYLKGRFGGYVSAIALADSKESFLNTAFQELKARRVTPDDEYDEIEEISGKYLNRDLSDEWLGLCKLAMDTGSVAFNTFDVYTDN